MLAARIEHRALCEATSSSAARSSIGHQQVLRRTTLCRAECMPATTLQQHLPQLDSLSLPCHRTVQSSTSPTSIAWSVNSLRRLHSCAASLAISIALLSSPSAAIAGSISAAASSSQAQPTVSVCDSGNQHSSISSTASSSQHKPSPNPIAEVAGLLSGFLLGEEKDPVAPFVLNGTTFKKYAIEVLGENGERVLSRKRGFTVNSCVSGVAVASESPEYQALPIGARVGEAADVTCRAAESTDLKDACSRSCKAACGDALSYYVSQNQRLTGYRLDVTDEDRMLRLCVKDCGFECLKPGKAFDFSVPSRR